MLWKAPTRDPRWPGSDDHPRRRADAAPAVELTLLSRVASDQEITGPRLRGLLALLAGDLRTGCNAAPGWWKGSGRTSCPSTRPRRRIDRLP